MALGWFKREHKKSKKKKGRPNYRHSVTQVGGSGTEHKEVFYKTKGTDAKQQAKTATTDDKGNTTYKAESVKTKGGDYKVYGKESKKAGSFRDAFASASKAGKKVFTWNGLKYSTKKA